MISEINFGKNNIPGVRTGKGLITLWTLLAIWSISTITSLPGLAVTPILGDLDTIFPHVSDLEIQMLSSLPNLLIIPFVLLSGKMSESKGKIPMLVIGMSLFLLCGILYFFANTMRTLIIISCFLGMGAGIIIPLSTGLIADFFVGKYRTKQMGLSSGINNLTLVLATLLTGWLANINWHLPFIVYLIPIISLCLAYFLTPRYLKKVGTAQTEANQSASNTAQTTTPVANPYVKPGTEVNTKLLSGLTIIYFVLTCLTILVTLNISFVLQNYHIDSTKAGTIISIYFLAVTIPGFCVTKILHVLKNSTVYICIFAIALGFLCIILFKSFGLIALGCFLMGFGYGIIQPLIYDKTSLVATPKKTTFALACVMSGNYLAIILTPFIATFMQWVCGEKSNILFPFWINLGIAIVFAILAYWKRNSFLFSDKASLK